jgi:predicted O-methyltransferase YrrM
VASGASPTTSGGKRGAPSLEFHDFQMKPLGKALRTFRRLHPYLRRHVSNWVGTDLRYLAHLRGSSRGPHGKDAPVAFQLHLRRSGRVLELRSVREYHFFVEALYLACSVLGEDAAEEAAATLIELRQQLRQDLERVFTAQEIDTVATGGYPALKEIVLYLLVRRYRPKALVETGVAQGISSTFILRALADNGEGRLISIDLPNYNPEGFRYADAKGTIDHTYVKKDLGVGWIVPKPLRERWDLRLGASSAELPKLGDAKLDFFFHDSEHSYENMGFEYRWADGHLLPGALLVSDDIHWNSAFPEFIHAHPEYRVVADHRVGVLLRSPA